MVVRRSRHGGLLAPLTGDTFFWGTVRRTSWKCRSAARRGVPTPEVVAYATYPAPPLAAGSMW